MVGNHSRQIKTQICTVGDVGVCRRCILMNTNPLNCWARAVPLSHNYKHGISQKSGTDLCEYQIYRQNLGQLAKSKIPDRLGFSRHMKTRLKRPGCLFQMRRRGTLIRGGRLFEAGRLVNFSQIVA